MFRSRAGRTRLVAAAVSALAVAALFVCTPQRAAAKTDPRTYSLKKKVFGKSVGEWTAEWWQWAYSIPASTHPLIDTTGEFVEVGQRGPVWFLGGAFNSANVERTATIPSGKSLLVPLLNVEWDALDPSTLTFEQMKLAAAQYIAGVDLASLRCTVDGTPIGDLAKNRVVSPAFEYHIPADSVYGAMGITVPRGIFNPAVSDGYWVFLRPLPVGDHTIACEAQTTGGTLQRFTYHLTVVDHNRP